MGEVSFQAIPMGEVSLVATLPVGCDRYSCGNGQPYSRGDILCDFDLQVFQPWCLYVFKYVFRHVNSPVID